MSGYKENQARALSPAQLREQKREQKKQEQLAKDRAKAAQQKREKELARQKKEAQERERIRKKQQAEQRKRVEMRRKKEEERRKKMAAAAQKVKVESLRETNTLLLEVERDIASQKKVNRQLSQLREKLTQQTIQTQEGKRLLSDLKEELNSNKRMLKGLQVQQQELRQHVNVVLEKTTQTKEELRLARQAWEKEYGIAQKNAQDLLVLKSNAADLSSEIQQVQDTIINSFNDMITSSQKMQQLDKDWQDADYALRLANAEVSCLSSNDALSVPAALYLEEMRNRGFELHAVESKEELRIWFRNAQEREVLVTLRETPDTSVEWLEELDLSNAYDDKKGYTFWQDLQMSFMDKGIRFNTNSSCSVSRRPPPRPGGSANMVNPDRTKTK